MNALIIFCATTLGTITILAALVFIFFRPITEKGLFAPFIRMGDRAHDFLIVGVSVCGTYLAALLLKNYFKVLRPAIANPHLHTLIIETDYSFPSGHASVFSALAVALFFINKRAGIIFGVIAIVIGVARVLAGVHTPVDIVAGYVLGILCSSIVERLAK